VPSPNRAVPNRAVPNRAALNRTLRRLGLQAGVVVGFVWLWWVVAELAVRNPALVPTPADVWHQLVVTSTVHDGVRGYSGYLLWEHLWASVRRILLGAGIGTALGIAIGLLIGTVPVLRVVLEGPLTFIRQLPPLAYFSLLIIWLGIDEAPKIWLLLIAAMPPVAVATAHAVAGVHRDYVNGALSLGARRWDVIRHVIVPASLPEILVGVRLGTGVAYTSVVAAETVNGVPGIGGMIRDAQRYLQTDVVILGILLIGLSGVLLDTALRYLELRVGPWRSRA
jgi:taurine transport system permease protein